MTDNQQGTNPYPHVRASDMGQAKDTIGCSLSCPACAYENGRNKASQQTIKDVCFELKSLVMAHHQLEHGEYMVASKHIFEFIKVASLNTRRR